MTFRDQAWEERVKTMGDEAEGHFEEWAARAQLGYVRYGMNRPPLQMYKLPARLRYSPDYLMSNQFVECQGLGRDQVFKLKLDKAGCLHWWSDLHPTYLYVWDSKYERECFIHIHEFDAVLGRTGAELRAFPEGKAYFAVKADDIFAAGTKAPA